MLMIINRYLLVLSATGLIGASAFAGLHRADAAQPYLLAQQPGGAGSAPSDRQQGRQQDRQQGGPEPTPLSGQQNRPADPPPRPNFAAAAEQLGVTEAELIESLGLPSQPPSQDGEGHPSGPPPRLDIQGAAEQLGVTEEELTRALGVPLHPPGAGQPPE